jgi:hypothetical protein
MLTVDVEHDWGAATNQNLQFLRGLFDFLDDTGGSATLFVLGEVAEKLAETGVPKGVEVASHGMSHANLQQVSEDELAEEVAQSKAVLETAFNRKVKGFRAPYFLPPDNLWEVLHATGYEYSSSLVAGWFPRRYHNKVASKPFDRDGVKELPVPTFRFLPFAFGLSFMRLLWPVSKLLVPNKPYLFYYHTTELMATPPGDEEPRWVRLLYGLHRGMRARRMLYGFLEGKAPTSSVEQVLSGKVPVAKPRVKEHLEGKGEPGESG